MNKVSQKRQTENKKINEILSQLIKLIPQQIFCSLMANQLYH